VSAALLVGAALYGIVGGGLTHYSLVGDGRWYQDGHTNTKQLSAPHASVGVGVELNTHVSFELNYRHLASGKVNAAWESDETYGHDGVPHDERWQATSRWQISGASLDVLTHAGPVYARLGVLHARERWSVVGTDRQTGAAFTWESHASRFVPVVGLGWQRGNLRYEVTRLTRLDGGLGGVSAATLLGVSYVFR
jgi:hypothetical protein